MLLAETHRVIEEKGDQGEPQEERVQRRIFVLLVVLIRLRRRSLAPHFQVPQKVVALFSKKVFAAIGEWREEDAFPEEQYDLQFKFLEKAVLVIRARRLLRTHLETNLVTPLPVSGGRRIVYKLRSKISHREGKLIKNHLPYELSKIGPVLCKRFRGVLYKLSPKEPENLIFWVLVAHRR